MLKAVASPDYSAVEFRSSTQAATTAVLAGSPTYDNGSSGVGATLTETGNGALPAQDGITLVAGDRLLVKNQASALQNGIYVVTQVGTGGTPYILTRATDFNSATNITYGTVVPVDAGTTQAGTLWMLTGSGTITVGVTSLTFTQVNVTSNVITAAAVIADNAIVRGDGGARGVQDSALIISDTADLSGVKTLVLSGATSGTLTVKSAAVAGTNTVTLPAGTTDFSATGGTSQVLKQTSAGGAITVAQLAASDLSNGTTGSGAVVLVTSPTLVTPTLGDASATSVTTQTSYNLLSGTTTTLNGAINSAVTSLVLTSATGFPAAGVLSINGELMTYSAIATNTVTITTRGAYGTTAASHSNGDAVQFARLIVAASTSVRPTFWVGSGGSIGSAAGRSNVAFSPFISNYALRAITTGIENVGIGYDVLKGITTGNSNIGIGTNAGANLTTDSTNNVIIGTASIMGSASVSNSVIVGARNGALPITGALNVVIGFNAGANITSGPGNVILGPGLNAPSATDTGQLNIGNLIQGTGVYQPGANSSTLVTTGTLQIGGTNVTLPTADLTFGTAAKGVILKQGANGRVGTFVANGVTPVTVNNTSIAITDAIIISLNAVGGAGPIVQPFVTTITAATGFTVTAGAADTSTYNYAIIKNA